jgi:hypothetical protein
MRLEARTDSSTIWHRMTVGQQQKFMCQLIEIAVRDPLEVYASANFTGLEFDGELLTPDDLFWCLAGAAEDDPVAWAQLLDALANGFVEDPKWHAGTVEFHRRRSLERLLLSECDPDKLAEPGVYDPDTALNACEALALGASIEDAASLLRPTPEEAASAENAAAHRAHAVELAGFRHRVELSLTQIMPDRFPDDSSIQDLQEGGQADSSEDPPTQSRSNSGRKLDLSFRTMKDLVQQTGPPPPALVEHFLYPGAITTLGGSPAAGKTPLCMQLVKAIVSGEDFLGWRTARTGVVYLSAEGRFPTCTRAKAFGLDQEEGVSVLLQEEAMGVSWPDVVEAVTTRALDLQAGLLIIEMLLDWGQMDDENKATEVAKAYEPLRRAREQGLAVLVQVHLGKGGDSGPDDAIDLNAIRGSAAGVGSSDVVAIYKKPKGHLVNTRFLKIVRNRIEGQVLPALYTEISPEGLIQVASELSVGFAQANGFEEDVMNAVEEISDSKGRGAWIAEVRRVIGGSDRDARDTLKRLARRGRLKEEKVRVGQTQKLEYRPAE